MIQHGTKYVCSIAVGIGTHWLGLTQLYCLMGRYQLPRHLAVPIHTYV